MDIKRITKSSGFTIVELLIVIVVIAILAAITVVAFNNVQRSAEQSRTVSAVDAYEKALLMHKGEKNYFPVDSRGSGAYVALAPGETAEASGYGCLGNTYPAEGIFRLGECLVMDVEAVINGESTYARVSLVSSEQVNSAISPNIINQLPTVPLHSFEMTTEASGTGTLDGEIVPVSLKAVIAARGFSYSPQPSDEAGTDSATISYYMPGDAACGRGEKILLDLSILNETMLDEESGAIGSINLGDLSDQWTMCISELR